MSVAKQKKLQVNQAVKQIHRHTVSPQQGLTPTAVFNLVLAYEQGKQGLLRDNPARYIRANHHLEPIPGNETNAGFGISGSMQPQFNAAPHPLLRNSGAAAENSKINPIPESNSDRAIQLQNDYNKQLAAQQSQQLTCA